MILWLYCVSKTRALHKIKSLSKMLENSTFHIFYPGCLLCLKSYLVSYLRTTRNFVSFLDWILFITIL